MPTFVIRHNSLRPTSTLAIFFLSQLPKFNIVAAKYEAEISLESLTQCYRPRTTEPMSDDGGTDERRGECSEM